MAKFKGSTFQVGDIVEITEESDATGMLDFKKGEGYEVEMVQYNFNGDFAGHIERHQEILLRGEGGHTDWYHCAHFKLKENTVESNENHFKVGQTVWDVLYGKGVVTDVNSAYQDYPIAVKFPDGTRSYTVEGKLDKEFARILFFSEPKIIAETKPLFEPILGGGMTLAAVDKETSRFYRLVVSEETQEVVESAHGVVFEKELFDFYRLGEKIEFN